MVAVDTNVLVRLITQDDPAQAVRARRLFETEEIWIAKTVLLEVAWVLDRVYGFAHSEIADSLKQLAGLSNVQLEDPSPVAQTIQYFEGGIDFADALHLASRGQADRFATFGSRFARKAAKLSVTAFLP